MPRIYTYSIQTFGSGQIRIGRQGENLSTRIDVDVAPWKAEYPTGTISLFVVPPVGNGYLAAIEENGNTISWTIRDTDTAYAGHGKAELILKDAIGTVMKSVTANTICAKSVSAAEPADPPEAIRPWVEQILDAIESGGVGSGGGAPGVGIAKLEQTTASSDDGGINVWMATLTDGRTYPFEVRNGQRGSIGPKGEKGEDYVLTEADKQEIAGMVEGTGGGANIDDTTPSSSTTYSSSKIESELSALNEANAAQDERLNTLENASGIVTVEPAQDDVPIVFFGSDLPQTKTDTVMTFKYVSKTKTVSGYAKAKAQGNSSMSYPKKNQTINMYIDEALTESMKVDFKGWGAQKKHVYKANWIDLTHARNIVSAQLWGDVVKSRANYADLPELLRTSPNQGAIDGFPALVYANGVYQGRYTINIPKDGWMANMDKTLDTHCILCGENYVSGCFRAAANINGSDWSDELHDTVPDAIKTRWNEVISFVMNSTDDEFKTGLSDYFYVDSLIDYYIFGVVSCGLDAFGKNQIYMTYDGQKWIASMYDMDSTWGLWWNGSSFVATDYARTEFQDFKDGEGNLLYIRLEELFYEQIQARWAELKDSVLSYANIMTRFERFIGLVPPHIVKEDYASTTGGSKFTGIPSQSTNHIQQIRSYVAARLPYADEWFASLTPAEEVPCTGITLDQTTLTFTAAGTQTLTATVTPSNTTDSIVWSSSDSSIASVSGGVVTAKANGSATITATCGAYSASCAVSVSGIETGGGDTGDSDDVDYTLNPLANATLMANQKYDSTTGDLIEYTNEYCTEKFTLQNCIYELKAANGSYPALFIWDETGRFLGLFETRSANFGRFSALAEYTYAIKVYNPTTKDISVFTLMPVDNRATAVEPFEVSLRGKTFTDGGSSKSQYVCVDEFAAAGIAIGEVATKINKINAVCWLMQPGSSSSFTTPLKDVEPAAFFLHDWPVWSNIYLAATAFTTSAKATEYFADHDYVLKFN